MLKGKVAVVTGSTAGIGFAIAQRMAEEGASVVISSRRQPNVDKAVASLKALGLQSVVGLACHVGKAEQREALIKAAVDNFGGIDILVHNVAVSPHFGPTMETSEMAVDKIFATNVKVPFLLTKEALPVIRPGGSVLLVSSVGAFLPFPLIGFYSVSKTAMVALTKLMAKELAESKIRVNCIAPGVIKTSFSKIMWDSKEAAAVSGERAFLGRVGEPKECGGMAAFLCSDDASYITGETIMIAGGSDARM